MPLISLWTKARRAQNEEDFETWIAGGVSPTLNAFDNATETRATVLIIDGTRVGDVRVYEDEVMQTVIQRWGTGGGNVPMIFENEDDPLVMRDREGCAGGAKGLSSRTRLSRWHRAIFILFSLTPLLYADSHRLSVSDCKAFLITGLRGKPIPTAISRWETR